VQERLANALAEEVGVTNKQISQLKKSEKEHLLRALTAWQLPIQVWQNCRLYFWGRSIRCGGMPAQVVRVQKRPAESACAGQRT
jgi:predicted flavoprotein YhiN